MTGTTDPRSDMMADLAKAAEAVEAGSADDAQETRPEPVGPDEGGAEAASGDDDGAAPAEQPKSDRARDDGGRFAKRVTPTARGEAQAGVTPKPAPASAATQPEGTGPGKDPAAAQAPAPALKPPASWKPAAREKWASLPPEVQQEAVRVDREVRQAMQAAAEKSKAGEAWGKALEPFMPHIQAQGADPIRTAQNLFQTAYALQTAPLQHRAGILAQMVRTYLPGAHGLELLDQVLSGSAPAPGRSAPGPQVDPNAIAQQVTQQVVRTLQQQRSQAMVARGEQDIAEFAEGREFLDDVGPMMSTMLRAAAEQGLPLTLEQAYDAACRADPKVYEVLQQREEAARATASLASTTRARAAASSIRTEPVGGHVAAGGSDGVLGDLEANWAKLTGR